MGQAYQKRPMTFATDVTVGETLAVSSNATVSRTLTGSSRTIAAVQAATTSGTALNTWGVSRIQRKSSAGASTNLFTLAGAPIGTEKEVLCISAGSTRTCRVTLGTGVSFYSSVSSTDATLRKATFNAGKEGLILRALSTTKWFITSNLNAVSIATT